MESLRRFIGAVWLLATVLMLGMFVRAVIIFATTESHDGIYPASVGLTLWAFFTLPAIVFITWGQPYRPSEGSVPRRRRVYVVNRDDYYDR